jgi:hypothetical protein
VRCPPPERLHHDVWSALRRVARGDPPGSPELRDLLFEFGLAEWVLGECGV